MIYNQLPPLNAIKAFDAVMRQGSISDAALTLCVSQSAVSRHIANLEEFLGVKLLHRSKSGTLPTEQGKEFFEKSSFALSEIMDVSSKLRATKSGMRVIKISSLSSFVLRWLVPRIEDFQNIHPDIALEVSISDQRPNFDLGQIDCAIVSEPRTTADGRDTHLAFEELVVVGAANLLKSKPIKNAKDVLKHQVIHTSTRPDLWHNWCKDVQLIDGYESLKGLAFQDFYISIAACLAGRGLALVPSFLIKEDLANGKLIQPLASSLYTQREYRFALAPIKKHDRAVLAVKDWLVETTRGL